MRRALLAASVAAVVFAACALPAAIAAEPKKAPDPEKLFAKKDANSDGSLTLEEFKAGMKDKALENADKRFRKVDTNGDSKLSLDEFKAGMQPKK